MWVKQCHKPNYHDWEWFINMVISGKLEVATIRPILWGEIWGICLQVIWLYMLQWLHFRVPTFPLKFEMGLSRLSPNFWLVYTSHLLSKWCLIVNSLIMINIICGKDYRWHNHDHSIKAGPIFLLWELNRVTRGARNPILNLLPPFMVKSQWLASKKRSPQVPQKKPSLWPMVIFGRVHVYLVVSGKMIAPSW